jgi:hypothetical protein
MTLFWTPLVCVGFVLYLGAANPGAMLAALVCGTAAYVGWRELEEFQARRAQSRTGTTEEG